MKKKRFLTFTMACVMTLALAVGLAACGHEHTMTEVKAVEATCTSAGNSAYYVCSDCGKYFSDAEGADEIEKDSWIVDAKGHSYGAWTVDTAATFFGKGVEKRVCANDASHTETRSISAIGSTAGVFDAFNVYSDACVQGRKGIILKKDVENETGASTYFGEADKNYDWNGSKMTLSFDLDLSALTETDDYTQFILAFNYQNGEQFVHADEIRFGIVKTENGFVVNQMSGRVRRRFEYCRDKGRRRADLYRRRNQRRLYLRVRQGNKGAYVFHDRRGQILRRGDENGGQRPGRLALSVERAAEQGRSRAVKHNSRLIL